MFSFGNECYSYWQSFIRLIYPASCSVCRTALLLYENHLCSHCSLQIKPLKGPKCVRCTRALPPYGTSRSVCTNCMNERPFFHRGFSLIAYEAQSKKILHEIKFQKKPWLLKSFSKLFTDALYSQINLSDYDLMIPVPLDQGKIRERGFNQAEILAEMLRDRSRATLKIKNVITKKKKTAAQSQLRRMDRLANLNGAFELKRTKEIKGKYILLVDDIFTTGSTINECAKLLKEHGAERVDFFTLARS